MSVLGPLFTIEALTTSRRHRYFFVRVVYALVLLLILWMSYDSATRGFVISSQVANVARSFFTHFTWLQLTAVMLLVPAMVAGTIAGEFERKTLDYLLACPISSFTILAGKLGARLLLAGLLIGTGIPILALAMMLGGIPPLALFTSAMVALSTLFVTGALTLATSVWSIRTRDALLRTYVLIIAVLVIPWGGMGMRYTFSNGSWTWVGELISTVSEPFFLIDPYVAAYTDDWRVLLSAVGAHVALGVSLITFSAWRLRSVAAWRGGGRRFFSFTNRWSWHWPRPKVSGWPMLWKEMFIEKTALRWGCLARLAILGLLVCIGIPAVGMFIDGLRYSAGRPEGFYLLFATLATFTLLLTLARGATLITGERERDTWLVLLSADVSGRQIVLGKALGNLYAMRWLVGLLTIVWSMACILRPAEIWRTPLVIGELLLLMFFCSLLSVRYSLTCRTSLAAMGAAIGTGFFVGGGYLFCCAFPVGMILRPHGGDDFIGLMLAPCIPFLLGYPMLGLEPPYPGGRESLSLFVGFLFGTGGYVLATFAIYKLMVIDFDQRAGRTTRAEGSWQRVETPPVVYDAAVVEPVKPTDAL